MTDEAGKESSPSARWLSTSAPTPEEMARQQCVAFLDSTLNPVHTQDEAALWTQAFAVVVAARQSLANSSAFVEVEQRESEAPRFRLMPSIA
jgi:hypothetical protein